MSTLDANSSLAQVLDERHALANQAFADCDMDTYASVFSPDLKYTQTDGTILPTDAIFDDIANQFRRLVACSFDNRRTNLSVETSEKVIEDVDINALVELRYCYFLKRRIRVSRNSTFTWQLTHSGWQVINVVAHTETIGAGGWRLRVSALDNNAMDRSGFGRRVGI